MSMQFWCFSLWKSDLKSNCIFKFQAWVKIVCVESAWNICNAFHSAIMESLLTRTSAKVKQTFFYVYNLLLFATDPTEVKKKLDRFFNKKYLKSEIGIASLLMCVMQRSLISTNEELIELMHEASILQNAKSLKYDKEDFDLVSELVNFMLENEKLLKMAILFDAQLLGNINYSKLETHRKEYQNP